MSHERYRAAQPCVPTEQEAVVPVDGLADTLEGGFKRLHIGKTVLRPLLEGFGNNRIPLR